MAELLTRQAILEADDLGFERVEVPEWGGSVLVRGLSGKERDRFEASSARMAGNRNSLDAIERALQNIRARLVAMTVVDENGKRLFSDADTEALGQKSGAVLDRLFDVARRLSGMTDEQIEALAEDFAGGPSGDSGSI